ncbi:hypothetical protein [Methylobacterium sp. P5_C11]
MSMPFGRTILAAVLWVVPTYGWAQASPSRINDCTFLTDPTDLRYCLFFEQGGRPALPVTILATGDGLSSIGTDDRLGGYRRPAPIALSPLGRPKVRVRLGGADNATFPQQPYFLASAGLDPRGVHITQVSSLGLGRRDRASNRRSDVFIAQVGTR